jgi:UDP-N-acetylglucosamine 2-epimerase (non-hydrolysing)
MRGSEDCRPWVQLVGGTRPEAIKLAPVAAEMTRAGRMRPEIVASGQHPSMFHQGLAAFGLCPDRVAELERRSGSQAELTGQLVAVMDRELERRRPAALMVQGDTTTAMAAALAAFWRQVPVVHLEAGLRSHDLASPFPEEANRKLIGQLASLHLAPTMRAADNLYREGAALDSVLVAGNTVVDAVHTIARTAPPPIDAALAAMTRRVEAGSRRLVVVTVHRRESWHGPLAGILAAVARLVDDHDDVEVVLPVHPNPIVRSQVVDALAESDRVVLTDPLAYPDMARLLARATLVLSDSGGIQEEAPTFGVPVLVLREVTERVEAIDAGCAVLVGSDPDLIYGTATGLLADDTARTAMTVGGNPFGDGQAAARSEQALAWLLGLQSNPPAGFVAGSAGSQQPLETPGVGGEALGARV